MNSKKSEEKAEKKPEEPKFTPAEYRDRFCLIKSRVPGGQSSVSAPFAVANSVFQWEAQAHHYGADSFKLTRKQFEAAILSAMKYPCVAPLPAAVPPIIKDKFKNFKPKG